MEKAKGARGDNPVESAEPSEGAGDVGGQASPCQEPEPPESFATMLAQRALFFGQVLQALFALGLRGALALFGRLRDANTWDDLKTRSGKLAQKAQESETWDQLKERSGRIARKAREAEVWDKLKENKDKLVQRAQDEQWGAKIQDGAARLGQRAQEVQRQVQEALKASASGMEKAPLDEPTDKPAAEAAEQRQHSIHEGPLPAMPVPHAMEPSVPPARRNGCWGCLVVLIIMIGLLKIAVSNDTSKQAREKQESLETHQRLLPQYAEPMKEAAKAFREGDFAKAQDAFFEAERFAQSVKRDHGRQLYYNLDWDERYVSAVLGRAACLVEQGDEENAKALLLKMITQEWTRKNFPVNSPKSEALLVKIREARKEREAKDRDEAIRESFHDAAMLYMDKLRDYSAIMDGKRWKLSNPRMVRAEPPVKDQNGTWIAALSWMAWIERPGEPKDVESAFFALLAHDGGRWKITKRWIMFPGGKRKELGGELTKLIPDI